ncbi:hypothetical protein FB45DRAFT_1065170 [Roridomyces roridus]|uniref:Uncharacterized protein n=1 Tax=Roridomyces roridus TaxID=1738132 RepID=A0AAD7B7H0_9AGAR|nr:hypothetical protein FB45DRAFT_1065170 [Roridomyces roridus]
MVDNKSAAKARAQQEAKAFLDDPILAQNLYSFDPQGPKAARLVQSVQSIHSKITSLDALIDFVLRMHPNTPIATAFEDLRARFRAAKAASKAQSGVASHREKHHFINSSGLRGHGRSIEEIIASQDHPNVGSVTNPRIIWRERMEPVGLHTNLADTKCRQEDDHIVVEDNGYLIPNPDESFIILAGTASKPAKKDGNYIIELVALQGVLSGEEFAEPIYEWMSTVIGVAVTERGDVRPKHDGLMVQAGYNAGPRHAHVFGPAKSFKKNLDQTTMIEHDEDVISAMALTWAMFRSFMPSDLVEIVDGHLADAGLPKFGTRNVESGDGHRLTAKGKEYNFAGSDRGPCEIILSQDYSAWAHTDKCYAEFCIDWTVKRVDRDPNAPLDPPRVNDTPTIQTRAQALRAELPPPPPPVLDPPPADGGGHFVDCELKIKVPVSTGTFVAFRPKGLHGTTKIFGATIRQSTISFASRILDAFQVAQQGVMVQKKEGAGEGNN